MAYVTSKDCENRLGGDFSSLYELPAQQDDLVQDMANAEAVVNGFIGKRYQVPVTDSQALTLVRAWTLDLFAELAYGRGAGSEIPEKHKDRADQARTQLEQVAKGMMTLAGATAVTPPSGSGGNVAVVDGAAPIFQRDNMDGY